MSVWKIKREVSWCYVICSTGSEARFRGPDREANARKFMHMGELVEAAERISELYTHRHQYSIANNAWEALNTTLAKIKGE